MSLNRYTTSFTELTDTIAVNQMPAALNGQLLIGNGTGLVLAGLTGGTGVTIASGSGTITVNCTVAPADASGAVQFNVAGAFTGDAAHFYYDAANHRLGLGTNAPHATLDVQGSYRIKRQLVTASAYTVDATAADYYIAVNYTAGVCTVTLPPGNTGDGGTRTIWVGDESGNTSGGGIHIIPAGSDTINGNGAATPYVMSVAYGTVMLKNDGAGAGAGHWTASAFGPYIGTGTVYSTGLQMPSPFVVAGSPITSSGTFVVSLGDVSANTVWAGPTGASGQPSFRSLVPADIPGLPASKITSGTLAQAQGGTNLDTSAVTNGQLLIGNAGAWALHTLTAGNNVSITNGAGTITINADNYAAEPANTVFAGPTSGGNAVPTFRALVAADIPSLPASQITTGQLATARGGTGLDGSAAANGALLIGNGAGFSLATLTAGTNVTITNSAGGITIAASSGGGGTGAAGATGAVQYNSAGALAGDATNFYYDSTNHRVGILTSAPSGSLDNQGSKISKRTVVNSSPYTATATDYYLAVNTGTLYITITLPAAALGASGSREIIIVDETGSANTHPITINPAAGDHINGSLTTFSLSTSFGKVTLLSDGSSDWTATYGTPSSNSGSGTVTSVGLALPAQFSVTGSPVTTSGTLTGAWANQGPYLVFASPGDGSTNQPTFRSLVPGDIPNLPASIITSGQLTPAQGGTGINGSAAPSGQILIGNGSGYTLAAMQTTQGLKTTTGAGSLSLGLTPRVTVAYSGTPTFDLSQGDIQAMTLAGNPSLSLANVTVGLPFTLYLTQDGTGNRSVASWFGGITWNTGVPPLLSSAPGKTDRFDFLCTSAGNYYGVATLASNIPSWSQINLASGSSWNVPGPGNQIIVITGTGSTGTTLTLPTVANFGSGFLIVKDRTGNAAMHNITINATSAYFDVSGIVTTTISTNYGVLRLWCDTVAAAWYIV